MTAAVTITLTVSDGLATTSTSFFVTVMPAPIGTGSSTPMIASAAGAPSAQSLYDSTTQSKIGTDPNRLAGRKLLDLIQV